MNAKLVEIADWVKENPHESGGDIYHPLPFPEFSGLRSSGDPAATELKWELIRGSLADASGLKGKRVLDVGANAGFYSFSLARLGAAVEAYEPHEYYTGLGRRISDATGLDVTWFGQPLTVSELAGKQYEIALMLSVFQWISEGNKKLPEAVHLLEEVSLRTQNLYFELGCNSGKSAIRVDGDARLWIWRLLAEHTRPKKIFYLGSAAAWGNAKRYLFLATEGRPPLSLRQRVMTCGLSWLAWNA